MAAYAAIVSLMKSIEQIKNHPHLSNCFDDQQFHSLLQEAGSLLEFIEGYNHGDLEREITSAAHAAEDVIESHVVDQIHAGTVCSIDLQQVIQDMGAVAERAMEVVAEEGVREEEQPPTHPRTHVESGGNAMVGLEDELTRLLDSLINHHSNRHVISIVGMGGTGKTILAQNVYVNPLVTEHFDIHAWATVSQQYNLQQILSQLLSSLGKSTKGNVGHLGEDLHKTLFGRRYLIVLDDIWGVEAWDEVRHYFPDDRNRSRVVLTTRLSNVASVCASKCFNLNLLDENKSWKLFCVKALFPHKDDPLQLENVAKSIVKSCKGLALSIVVIGGLLLNSPRTVVYWEKVLKGLRSTDSEEKQKGLDVLSSSYNHLPPHLKPCFLYMGLFAEDSRISVSNITRLWVAEGFIKPKESRVLEEIAEDYLKDLSDRNLVISVERRHTGKIKCFSIHDLVRDLCLKVAEEQQFFHVRKGSQMQGTERSHTEKIKSSNIHGLLRCLCLKVDEEQQFFHVREESRIQGTERRLFCHSNERNLGNAIARSILGKEISLEYDKCKLLRVLDATRSKIYKPSTDVYMHVNLRYLAQRIPMANVSFVRSGFEVNLQTSACLLWNLQTLIIKWMPNLVIAPLEIWKMRQLRHLKCGEIYLPDPPPPLRNRQDYMENLQTLRKVTNLRLSEEVCEIIPNIKKLHLIYNCNKHGYDDSLMIKYMCNLDRFRKLESLNLESTYERHLKLAFPKSLNKLCLENCVLCWEDVSMTIGSLPQLQLLHLDLCAFIEGEDMWSPISGQFCCLKFLAIDTCSLRTWDADSSHFPILEKLTVCKLRYLKEIPLDIGEIPSLEFIRVDRCSESAAISAVKIKKYQLENNSNDALQIEVVVSELGVESLMTSLEAEELALNLFKLIIL